MLNVSIVVKLFFATFKQKVAGIKCHENSKINMSRKFKVMNWWNGKKTRFKIHLFEQKPCYLLPQLSNIPNM